MSAPAVLETVLVAEDDTTILKLVSHLLGRQGYTVLEAPGGPEALALAETYNDRIHLLLTDVVMPNLDGKALSLKVLKLHPGMRVLFMSGYMITDLMNKWQIMPADLLLSKPFTSGALLQMVRSMLDD
jgi:CheY-like chemotaxis protein